MGAGEGLSVVLCFLVEWVADVCDSSKASDASTQLWTTRYAPQTLKEICGNKGQVEKLQNWLNSWSVSPPFSILFISCSLMQPHLTPSLHRSSSRQSNFKKPGKEGMNVFRAVMITGPPGIGKTTSAHLCAKLAGFTPIEVNASDSRSKKFVEVGILFLLLGYDCLLIVIDLCRVELIWIIRLWMGGWVMGK